MTEDTTYNGWKNYPTWCVNLWITNDQGRYDYWTNLTEHLSRTQHPNLLSTLADRLREETRNEVDLMEASMRADLLGYALDGVNWYEIAVSMLEASVPA